MTFFNKKTEVMQIEMTPYGRYLYSIGKFKPHSYEFVDDDVIYRISGSNELQESAHSRILEETPKLKINRSFQDEAPQVESPPIIAQQRSMVRKNNTRQADILPMGRSAYSGSAVPYFQTTMLQGSITGSQISHEITETNEHGEASNGSNVLIPQIDVNFNFVISMRDTLDPQDDYDGSFERSDIFEDGTYLEIRYQEPIIHMKEFNSFYEKENFIIEAFEVSGAIGSEVLRPLKIGESTSGDDALFARQISPEETMEDQGFYEEEQPTLDFLEYFFSITTDEFIPQDVLCKVVNKLEINSHFLDEELICPDQRTDRFDIYGTRVSPQDLEDCD